MGDGSFQNHQEGTAKDHEGPNSITWHSMPVFLEVWLLHEQYWNYLGTEQTHSASGLTH